MSAGVVFTFMTIGASAAITALSQQNLHLTIKIASRPNNMIKHPSLQRCWTDPIAITIAAISIAAILTASITLPRSFPINDGGFWYLLASHLLQNGPELPSSILFNGRELPVAYPPLAAYVLALASYLSNSSLDALLLYLPAAIYLANVGLVARLSYQLFGNTNWFKATTLLFPLLPYAYRWFIMGGGVARSLGFSFQILSWLAALALVDRKDLKTSLRLCLWLSLALLTHPEAALWSMLGYLALTSGRVSLRLMLLPILGTVALTAPWLGLVLYRHGLGPFLNVLSSRGDSLFALLIPADFLGVSPVGVGLAFAGLFLTLASARRELALLWLVGLLLDSRGASLHNGVVLVAVFCAKAVETVSAQLCARATSPSWAYALIAGFSLFLGLNELTVNSRLIQEARFYMTEPREQELRELREIGSKLAENKESVALLSRHALAGDALGEWLSVYSGVPVVNMHQMAEWHGDFERILSFQYKHTEACCAGVASQCATVLNRFKATRILVHERSCGVFSSFVRSRPECLSFASTPQFTAFSCQQS